MNKLEVYSASITDLSFAKEYLSTLRAELDAIDTIPVNSSININAGSSDKQYVYAISILNNQILACKELGIDPQEYEDIKVSVLHIKSTVAVCRDWQKYSVELYEYSQAVHKLLSNDELFSLLQAPVKP
jgi:hypothetical protein